MKKRRRLLLINPYIHDFAYFGQFSKPLGLLYIASILDDCGYDIEFIDCLDMDFENAAGAGENSGGGAHLLKKFIDKPPELKSVPRRYKRYGISHKSFSGHLNRCGDVSAVLITSMMTYWYPGLVHTISIVKNTLGDAPVILGGIYPTLEYDHAKKFSGADHVFRIGDENSALKLIDNICGSERTGYVDFGRIFSYRYPAFQMYKKPAYLPIITSRGCPFSCSYCVSRILAPSHSVRSFINTADEIEYWVKNHGAADFVLYDDAFLYRANENALPLLDEIVRRSLKVRFHTPNALHARFMTEKIAAGMKAAGFCSIRLGLETHESTLQKSTGAKVTNSELENAVKCLISAGFKKNEIGVYILAGMTGQKFEDVVRAVDFVRDAGAKPVIAEYSPIRGSAMFDEAAAESMVDIRNEPLFQNNTLIFLRSREFTFERVESLKKMARER